MRIRAVLATLAIALLAPATAFASLADEQRQGQQLLAQLQSGGTSCADLSTEDFDHIGEYVMGRALGSTSSHQAMNDRMQLMMGAQAEKRMHQSMGQRFAGCRAGASGGGVVMGPRMMNGSTGDGGWGPMMSSGDYRWMIGGNWRTMTRQDWQRLRRQWLGTSTTTGHHGWSAWAIVAATLVGALLAALIATTLLRRAVRRRPATTST